MTLKPKGNYAVMAETFAAGAATMLCGDCIEIMASIAPDTFHACVTDPPYHLASIVRRYGRTTIDGSGTNEARARARSDSYARHSGGFMGQAWDGGDIAFQPETWAAVLRVLKPGAHLVAFAAPKNEHRLTCAIEDAGFEIRDKLMWLFGVGFPKNHDAKKAMAKADDVDLFREHLASAAAKWEGWGTALKPAYEPIILARKPLAGSVQENLREHGTGALNINACRVHGPDVAYEREDEPTQDKRYTEVGGTNFGAKPGRRYRRQRLNPGSTVNKTGEWKQDAEYEGELKPGRWPANALHDGSEEVVAAFPAQAGALAPVHRRSADKFRNTYGAFKGDVDEQGSTFRGDSGSAARFFYCAKATKADRAGSKHPTIKPVSLLRYLVRLVTPPDGLILDCFAGTGTTAAAALLEGARSVLIEKEDQYQADIRRRLGKFDRSAA